MESTSIIKKIVALCAAAMLCSAVMLAVGCSSATSSDTTDGSADVAVPQTREITDAIGRTVTIPSEVRTAATNGNAARLVCYAGAADKLIGCGEMDKKDAVAMPYSHVYADTFKDLPPTSAGGNKNTPYDEKIVKLAPDVIISSDNDPRANDELQQRTGIPVLVVTYQDDVLSDRMFYSLDMLGRVFGTTDHTDEVVAAMKGWKADLDDRTKDIPDSEKPRCYTGAVSYKGAHGFEGTYANYMPFQAIHAINVADETGERAAFIVDLEKVSAWDPDIIFLNPQNMGLVDESYASNPDFYRGLRAVQEGKVYSQPSFNYNGTNAELAICDAYYAGKVMFPDAFADVDMDAKVDEVFEMMLGSDYAKQLDDAGLGYGKLTIGK